MLTARELFAKARARIKQVSSNDIRKLRDAGEPFVLIDVREAKEWNLGHIPGAIHISRGILESNIEAHAPRDANVVLYCASGNRSALSVLSLQEMGYQNVSSMEGGFKDWVATGGDVED